MRAIGDFAESVDGYDLVQQIDFAALTQVQCGKRRRRFGLWPQEGKVEILVTKHDFGSQFTAIIAKQLHVAELAIHLELHAVFTIATKGAHHSLQQSGW